ncbi:hypothetical protein JCM10908_000417 [Rhodotorula pacifica]|uniref:Nas2p n=1 Tax=Rhodotorula pacifica TaxID=1495444 RepID=UPI00317FFE85
MSIPDALHAPSGPSSLRQPAQTTTNGAPVTLQSEVMRLTEARKGVEAQLDAYFDVLKSNNCTMDTPLVDPEGFPRADIDVAGVRTARVQIIRLRNDLKAVMREMEQVVLRGLPRGEGESGDVRMNGSEGGDAGVAEGDERPFARVDAVAPNSPANQAGLQREDLLLSIGSVSSENHDNLRAVAALVGRSEGVALPIAVLRESSRVELVLTPRSGWGGRGLLGCHIVPV